MLQGRQTRIYVGSFLGTDPRYAAEVLAVSAGATGERSLGKHLKIGLVYPPRVRGLDLATQGMAVTAEDYWPHQKHHVGCHNTHLHCWCP